MAVFLAVSMELDGTKNCAPNRCQMPRWNYVTETICTTAQDICLPEQLRVVFATGSKSSYFFFFILMQSVCCRCAFIQFPFDREMYHSCSAVTSCCQFPSHDKAGVHQNCGGHTKLLLPLRANQQRRAGIITITRRSIHIGGPNAGLLQSSAISAFKKRSTARECR